MDSQILRQRNAEDGSPSEGGDGPNHEKKSVIKVVKEKAKKIKDTLKTHGHGHDHVDHDNNPPHDQSHEEEYDDDNEETVKDPDVHGATTMYDTGPGKSAVGEQKPGVNLGRPTVVAEDWYDSKHADSPKRPSAQRKEENSGKHVENLGTPTAMGVTEHVPETRDVSLSSGSYCWGGSMEQPKISSETPTSMEEDPHGPKDRPELSNYQTKVEDPTGDGGQEAGITPIICSFDKMNVCDEPESKTKAKEEAESHHQISPGPVPHHNTINPDDPGSILKSFDPNKPQDQPHDTVAKQPASQSVYTTTMSYATSAIADKAIAAKNMVTSKLGYGSNEDPTAAPLPKSTQGEEIRKSVSTGEYAQKIVSTVTEKLAPVYEKVSNAGSSVASKVRGTGTEVLEQERGDKEEEKNGVSVKEYLAEKLRPSDEDKALSEMISDSLRKQKLETKEKPTVGNVTESEEVSKRLGSDEDSNREMKESETGVAANASSTGKAAFESFKGAVTSWLSPGGGQKQTSAPGTTHGEDRISSSTGEETAAHGKNGAGEERLQE